MSEVLNEQSLEPLLKIHSRQCHGLNFTVETYAFGRDLTVRAMLTGHQVGVEFNMPYLRYQPKNELSARIDQYLAAEVDRYRLSLNAELSLAAREAQERVNRWRLRQ